MGFTPRVRLLAALACGFCVIAAVLIGGLGVLGVRSATRADAKVTSDELATTTITAQVAHDVDAVYSSGLGLASGGDSSSDGAVAQRLYGHEVPAVEAQLNDLVRIHQGDSASELAGIALLQRQWVNLRAVVNERQTSVRGSSYYRSQLRAAYDPLSRHLAALVKREIDDARTDHLASARHTNRIGWGIITAVVFTAVIFLLLCLTLLRLLRRAIEPGQEQVEFADTLQLAENEAEAHSLLRKFLERVVTESSVTIFNRNNSADRLEAVTDVSPGSVLERGLAHAEPRSCIAVRSARVHDQDDRRPSLLNCSVCGDCPGMSTCSPLTVGGEVIGSVLVNRSDSYTLREQTQVRDAVAQSAPVLANLRNLAIAELRASTDSLTGLPNKRAVADSLNRMLAQATRRLSPLSVLLLDLDHFKTVNDRYGHPVGDQILANVGVALRSSLRDGDFAGRNGGEEFILLLPDTEIVGARSTAEKVRAAIEDISIPGLDLKTTASIGIAAYPEHAANPDRLERLADAALYLAKRSGRNRVEVATTALDSVEDSSDATALRAMT